MKPVVFIDGKEGTTGLQIYDRLTPREDIELLLIDDEKRKDPAERKKCLNAADLVFLCLPDDAAREAVAMIENPNTRVIDASTAHRTAPGWDYGFPELSKGHREAIVKSKRVANPGCHASGFISCVYPLVQLGLIYPDQALHCYSLTGYSGGGKKLIAEYQDPQRDPRHASARIYGTNLQHKHLPEMVRETGLLHEPAFLPVVADFYSGMESLIPVFAEDLRGSVEEIREVYRSAYQGPVIRYREAADEGGFYSAAAFEGRDDMEVTVSGNEERVLLVARFDNLGKGASGAAIQNMNLVFGFDETSGLRL